MSEAGSDARDQLVLRILVGAMAASAALLLVVGRHLTFWSDELDWLTFADDFSPGHLLTPHGSHLLALPRVIYEGVPRLFGSSYFPFRLLALVSFQTCAVLVFVLVRLRQPALVALLPAVVLLFFGSAQDMTLSPLGIPFTLSIALGLGAMVAVERDQRHLDAVATALLLGSILAHTFGTIIAFGLAAYFLLEPSQRRRIWIAAIPLILWFAWWLWARQFHQDIASASNAFGLPLFLISAAGAALQGLVGIPPDLGGKVPGLAAALRIFFDLLAVTGAVMLALWVKRRRGTPWLFAYLVMTLAFWVGIGLAEGDGREPTAPRYLFFGGIMVILIAAEALRGFRPSPRSIRFIAASFAVCLAGNVALLLYEVPGFNTDAANVRAQLGVLRLEQSHIDPHIRVRDLGSPATIHIPSSAGDLNAFENSRGDLGFTAEEIVNQPEPVRRAADFVDARSIGLAAQPIPRSSSKANAQCWRRHPDPRTGTTNFALPPGFNAVTVKGPFPSAEIRVGRFADEASVAIGSAEAEGQVAILIPSGDAGPSWFGEAAGTVRVCTVGAQ